MSFRERNFSYITKPFGKFLDEIRSGGKQYLRSLALDKPADRPASFAIDYPEIGYDFQLPAELVMVDQNAHSSVLRISGPVAMWLHYDVCFPMCYCRASADCGSCRLWLTYSVKFMALRSFCYILLRIFSASKCHLASQVPPSMFSTRRYLL